MRRCLAIAFGLYFVPALGTYFVPWLALLVPVGVLVTAVALAVTYRLLCCPKCGGRLGNLFEVRQSGKLFGLPPDLDSCPHCDYDLDAGPGHDNLLEILSAYEQGGEFCGVVGAPVDGALCRYEVKLAGDARRAFERILRLRPFGKHGGVYRYFVLTPSLNGDAPGAASRLRVRVEKGPQQAAVDVHAPAALQTVLKWIQELQRPDQVTGLMLQAQA